MKILWIHQNYVSSAEAGNSRAEFILNSFLDAGWEVELICTNETYFGNERKVSKDIRSRLKIHYIDIKHRSDQRIKRKSISYLKFCYLSIAYLKKISKPDVIYCSSPPLPQVLAGIFASQYFRAKLIIEVRDLWPAFLIDGGLIHSKIVIKALYWIEALFYRQADHCISVSPGFHPYLREMGIAKNKIIIAPTAENNAMELISEIHWRHENNLRNSFIILYAGSMNEAYNIQLLVDTAIHTTKSDKEIVWVFAGDGREAFKVKAMAQKHKRILYLGSLPKNEIISLMRSCNLGVNAHANWPLLETVITGKLIDYLSSSLPVVSCSLGIIDQILISSGGGLTAEPSVNGMSKAVFRLKGLETNVLSKMGENGQAWLSAYINPAHTTSKIQSSVINSVTGAPFSYFRIIGNIVGAFKDVLARKAEKAIYRCYRNEVRQTVLQKAFRDWVMEEKRFNDN